MNICAFDKSTDIWQLGILFYFIFYEINNINQINPVELYQGKNFTIPKRNLKLCELNDLIENMTKY